MAMIGDRWNVTDDEVARSYPCDEIVATANSAGVARSDG